MHARQRVSVRHQPGKCSDRLRYGRAGKAAELLLEDYDTLKKSDGYLYDLADVLKQVLSNSSQKYHREMVSAYRSADIAKFNEASDQFLSLIDKVEEVLGTRKEFLFGTWTEQAKKPGRG